MKKTQRHIIIIFPKTDDKSYQQPRAGSGETLSTEEQKITYRDLLGKMQVRRKWSNICKVLIKGNEQTNLLT